MASLRVPYIRRLDLFCDSRQCQALDANRRLMFPDYGHWTVEGQKCAGKALATKYRTIQALFSVEDVPEVK